MYIYSQQQISANTKLTAEVAIIGSGAGGATIAQQMVEAGFDTLLLEEGPFIPLDNQSTKNSENIHQQWRSGGLTAALGKPAISYAEGRCVGGGTEINSGIFQQCPAELLSAWADRYQIQEFSEAELQPFYDQASSIVSASLSSAKADSLVLQTAAEKLRWQAKMLPRAQKVTREDGIEKTVKQSMTKTLLPQALNQGLRLIANCKVTKLAIKKSTVTAITAIAINYQGQQVSLNIKAKYVFVCAGAIHTPFLLKRSGLTNNIGNSLSLHPTIKTLCLFDKAINQNPSAVPLCAITEFMPDKRIGGSAFNPGFFAMSVAEDWGKRAYLLDKAEHCGIYYAMIKPSGIGKVRAVVGMSDPVVSFALTKADWSNLGSGLTSLGQAMFASGAQNVYPSIIGHAGWRNPQQAREYAHNNLPVKNSLLMTIHLFSSCPLGGNKQLCATDSFGKLHQMRNLYIADASLIPEAPGVNPQASIMALALRNAQHFINQNR